MDAQAVIRGLKPQDASITSSQSALEDGFCRLKASVQHHQLLDKQRWQKSVDLDFNSSAAPQMCHCR